ncbi:non-canonical purine NTP pyrophosphatase [Candidatus Peregrinibacteria bacterium]|nr:MAG: non-canonical purine NTP pyrophosphatase [Candidatus Peregrinibacteria bacterium]
MKRILIATGNSGKVREMREVIGDLPAEFITLADLGFTNNVEETGTTYEENAFQKADFFFQKTGFPVIAEDSGLEVSALSGELGVQTRRWGAGEQASDAEWMEHFLKRMEGENDRSATFFCTAVFVAEGNIRSVFTGETKGILAHSPQCLPPKGIPVSALFIPEGKTKVYATMSPEEKNAVSHRGKAMQALKQFLEQFLSTHQKIAL